MRLEVIEGEGAGTTIEVPERGHYVLGRHPASDLKIKGKGVSRRHALLMLDGEERAIQDLGSQNGTWINGVKITTETLLKEGDRIRIGASVLLQVKLAAAPPNQDPIAAAVRIPRAMPPTRIRGARKRPLLDPDAPAVQRCGACDAPVEAKGLAARSGMERLDDGTLFCPDCSPGLSKKDLVAGRYRMLGHLGEGSAAVVWKAIDEDASRLVALKVVKSKNVSPNAATYLEREIEILRELDHPSIVRLLDAGTNGQDRFFAMELVRGLDLGSLVENQGPLPSADAAYIGFQIAGALALAHKRGIVHRDLKPSNVLIDPEGKVKLADFGVARITTGGAGKITKRGSRRGTPAYMAPEQARDPASAGPPADVYGLGATLYHAVSGAPPYGQGTPVGVILEKLDKGEAPAAFGGSITSSSIGLTDAIVVAMNADPKKRFADGQALRTALLTVLDLSARVRFPR